MKPELRHQCRDLSLLLGLGEEGTDSWCWAAFVSRMCYRHYSMLIRKNRVLGKRCGWFACKTGSSASQSAGALWRVQWCCWGKAILEGQCKCKASNYLSLLALSRDDRMECFQNCSAVPLLSWRHKTLFSVATREMFFMSCLLLMLSDKRKIMLNVICRNWKMTINIWIW